MRLLPCALAAIALSAATSIGHAQSPYDYPWCAELTWTSGATSCYYTSYRQCMETLRGIGGSCIQNPGYRGSAPVRHEQPYH
jgi:hypothetical protein